MFIFISYLLEVLFPSPFSLFLVANYVPFCVFTLICIFYLLYHPVFLSSVSFLKFLFYCSELLVDNPFLSFLHAMITNFLLSSHSALFALVILAKYAWNTLIFCSSSCLHSSSNHSLPSTSQPCHYTNCAVLAVSLLAMGRNNVHAVELEALTAAV